MILLFDSTWKIQDGGGKKAWFQCPKRLVLGSLHRQVTPADNCLPLGFCNFCDALKSLFVNRMLKNLAAF